MKGLRLDVHITNKWKRIVLALLFMDVILLFLWVFSAVQDIQNRVIEPNPHTGTLFFLTWLFCIAPLHILLYFKNKKKWKLHMYTFISGFVVFLTAFLLIKDSFFDILEHPSILPLTLVIVLVLLASAWFATLFILPLWELFKKGKSI